MDAKVQAISAETRFGSAYTAIRMLADVALHAHGYRTLTSKPGHHRTAIQTLPTTLGVDPRTVVRLDVLRKQRRADDGPGRPFDSVLQLPSGGAGILNVEAQKKHPIMAIPIIRLPVTCPICQSEVVTAFNAAEMVEALLNSKPPRLYASCHDTSWFASESEVQRIRQCIYKISVEGRSNDEIS